MRPERWFQRRAEWIWRQRGLAPVPLGAPTPDRVAAEVNRTVYFRRVVTVASPVTAAPIFVSADGRYQLFVNGQRIGRGPARCSPDRQCVDSYELAPFLQPGKNVIAALVRAYGRHTAWYELPRWEHGRIFGCGGFFLQGDVVCDKVNAVTLSSYRLDTDQSWHFLEAEAWQRDAPGGSLGFVEIFDLRKEPAGWTEPDFDAGDWLPAEVLRLPGANFAADVVPFPVMAVRDIPQLHEEIVLPKEIFNHEVTKDRRIKPRDFVVNPPGATLIVDFGRLVNGRLYFDVTGPAGAVLTFGYGERLQEDGQVKLNEGIPGYDTPYRHQFTLRGGRQQWEMFEWAAFRYVQLDLSGFQNLTGLTCHQISVNRVSYPVQANGRFSCSDTQLNRLWQAGADTVHACMHDAYMDCPTREQRQYVADAYVQMLVNFAAFGDTKLAARMLRQAAQSQRPNGLIMPAVPGDFARVSSFNIPDFTLYWIMAIEQYVLYSGDTAVLPELYLPVCKAITWFEQFLTADGLLTNVPHWVFVDWAELDKRGQVTALNAQFVAALRAAAALARYSGCADDVERFGETAVRVTKAINTHLWDEARGVYVDARHSRRISQQSNAAVIAFGVAPPERWLRILDVIMDAQRLVLTRLGDHDPAATAFDEASDVVLAQPFYAHHLHAALRRVWAAKNAIGVEALAGTFRLKPPLQVYLRRSLRRWEPMPDKNNGLFRETWQVGETTSLCHGWSATPTFDLSVVVLGVQPLTPGFDRTRIAPEPLGLAWAKGAFPTPHGAVVVDWRLENGRFMLNLVIPAGIEAEVTLPGETAVYVVGSGRHQIFNHEDTKD